MPARASDTRAYTGEETLQLLRETGISQFELRLYRRVHGTSSLVARFSNASVEHFASPERWVPYLAGGGSYLMSAHRQTSTWDGQAATWDEASGWPMIGGFMHWDFTTVPTRDVDLNAPSDENWHGPSMMAFPKQSDTVDASPAQYRWPKLKEPVRHLTLGYNPDIGFVMMDGKAGSMPSQFGAGFLERMYLMGEPSSENMAAWRNWNAGGDFAYGQGALETRGSLPGITVRVSNVAVFHCSFEVVKACSKGHVDASVLEAHARMLAKLNARRDTTSEQLEDAMVHLYMALERLKDTPLVGYQLNPVIRFGPNDDIKVDGVPSGMRLYLTGLVEEPTR